MDPRRRRWLAIGGVTMALLAALVAGWLYLPGIIAERTLGLMAQVICAPVDIEVSPDLSHASIARTECTVPAGPIASFALSSGAEVSLRDLRPTRIEVPVLAINPRSLELAGTATSILVTGDTPDPLRRALVALASVAGREDLPARIAVGEIDIGRGAHVIETHGLVITHGAGTFDIALPSLGPPPYHGHGIDWELGVNDLEIHATPGDAIVTGHFDVAANVFSFPISRTIAFRLTGHDLAGAGADYDLWIEPSAELTWLREHGEALLQEIQSAGGVRQAMEQRREERASDRAERVHDLREQLDQRVEQLREHATPPASTTP